MNMLLEARKIINDRIIDTCDPDFTNDYNYAQTMGRREGLREAQIIIDDLLENIIGDMAEF